MRNQAPKLKVGQTALLTMGAHRVPVTLIEFRFRVKGTDIWRVSRDVTGDDDWVSFEVRGSSLEFTEAQL